MADNLTQFIAQSPMIESAIAQYGVTMQVFIVVLIAILILKGLALFKAARLNEKVWFWVLFVTNTLAILPLIYLYMRRKRKI